MRRLALIVLLLAAAPAAQAEELNFARPDGFEIVTDKEHFLRLITGKALTRLGIRLSVDPRGDITGRAFGRSVSGNWDWNRGYFCRDLNYGAEPLEFNCQMVKVRGNTLRFISDRGQGIYADLRLR